MSEWVAAQPAETSAAAWAAVDELAHAYVADGEHRSLEQARADAMIDLILGQATITTTVELNLPLERADPHAPRLAGPGEASRDERRPRRRPVSAAGRVRRRAPAAAPHPGGLPGWCCSCRGSGSRRPGSG